jgi:Tol biopolymer transport system component
MPDVEEVFRLSTQKVEQDPGALERQFRRRDRRNRNHKLGAFAIAMAIGVAAIVLVLMTRPASDGRTPANDSSSPTAPPRSDAYAFVDVATGERTPLPWSTTDAFDYQVSPDGTRFAFTDFSDPPARSTVVDLDGTNARRISPPTTDALGVRWMTRSTLVYQGRVQHTNQIGDLFVVDVRSRETMRITHLNPATTYSIYFMATAPSPDGGTVLFQRWNGEIADPRWDIWSASVEGGEPTLVRRDAGLPAFSPDGTTIAFLRAPQPGSCSRPASCWRSHELWLMDADGTDERMLIDSDQLLDWPRWSPDGTRIAYVDGGVIKLVDVDTVHTQVVTNGGIAEWYDDDTLIVGAS